MYDQSLQLFHSRFISNPGYLTAGRNISISIAISISKFAAVVWGGVGWRAVGGTFVDEVGGI